MNALNETLFQAFLNRGVIQEKETEVRVVFKTSNPFGEPIYTEDDFTIAEIEFTTPIKLNLTRNSNGHRARATVASVKRIDGMTPEALADAFDLNLDGTPAVFRFTTETHAKKEMIGKADFVLPDGNILKDGMRVIFENDKTKSLNEIPLTVRGCGTSIELKKPRGRPKKEVIF